MKQVIKVDTRKLSLQAAAQPSMTLLILDRRGGRTPSRSLTCTGGRRRSCFRSRRSAAWRPRRRRRPRRPSGLSSIPRYVFFRCLKILNQPPEPIVVSALVTVIPPRSTPQPIHADAQSDVVVVRVGESVNAIVIAAVFGGEFPAVPPGRPPDGQGETGKMFNGIESKFDISLLHSISSADNHLQSNVQMLTWDQIEHH